MYKKTYGYVWWYIKLKFLSREKLVLAVKHIRIHVIDCLGVNWGCYNGLYECELRYSS